MPAELHLQRPMERNALRNEAVRPVFVDDPNEIVVVTIYYVYYF